MKRRKYLRFRIRLFWWGAITSVVVGPLASELVVSPKPEARSAVGSEALTLSRAVQIALENNPDALAARASVEAASGRARQSRAWPNPSLELATEDGPTRDRRVLSGAKQTVGVSQTIPFPGKKKLDRAIGVREVSASQALRRWNQHSLAREVKVAFFQVLAAERSVSVGRELAVVAERFALTARRRMEAGAAGDPEPLRAELQLEQAKAELAELELGATAARETLLAFLGQEKWRWATLSGELAETIDLAQVDRTSSEWLTHHPQVQAATAHRDQLQFQWRRAKLEPYPDFNVGVAGGRDGGPDRESIVEFRVSVPVPIFDRARGKEEEARAELAGAEAQRAAVQQRLERDWALVRHRLHVVVEQVASYRDRILPKSQRALELVQTGFDEGKFGFIDLLDIQRTSAEARLAYLRKLLELNITLAERDALVGPFPE